MFRGLRAAQAKQNARRAIPLAAQVAPANAQAQGVWVVIWLHGYTTKLAGLETQKNRQKYQSDRAAWELQVVRTYP